MPITTTSFYSDSLKLSANLYVHDNLKPGSKVPAIVLCQGLSGVKYKVLPEVAAYFMAAGYGVLAFDYRGCGDSEGDPHRLFPEERLEDVLAAIAYVRSLPNVDAMRLALYGISYGGGIALAAAAQDAQVRCVVSVSGAVDGMSLMRGLRTNDQWLDFKALLEKDREQRAITGKSDLISVSDLLPFGAKFWAQYDALVSPAQSESLPNATEKTFAAFTLQSAQAITDFTIANRLAGLAAKPTLLIHGEQDDVIAIEDALGLYEKIPAPKQFIKIPGMGHVDLDHDPVLLQVLQQALAWYKLYL